MQFAHLNLESERMVYVYLYTPLKDVTSNNNLFEQQLRLLHLPDSSAFQDFEQYILDVSASIPSSKVWKTMGLILPYWLYKYAIVMCIHM